MAETENPREFAEHYLATLSSGGDYVALYHEDITFTLPGLSPLGGTYRGLKDLKERMFSLFTGRLQRPPGGGVFPTEFIAEGNTVLVRARGRSRDAQGMPYNQDYFLWFELKDGKLYRYLDHGDTSMGWQQTFDLHME